ncbi:MAG TPA: hypothetical protein VNY05_37575 [Candidatus Acidoferrales bacterium]|jgi:hypothetical protein|nr:hypothetical protein [Candidatus Acidoferrales bacterium]
MDDIAVGKLVKKAVRESLAAMLANGSTCNHCGAAPSGRTSTKSSAATTKAKIKKEEMECPKCGADIDVPDDYDGDSIECPDCHEDVPLKAFKAKKPDYVKMFGGEAVAKSASEEFFSRYVYGSEPNVYTKMFGGKE